MARKLLVLLWWFSVVVPSAAADTKVWTGAVNSLWSVGGNWNGGVAPADGDALVFPSGTPFATRTNTNDLAGLDLVSVTTQDFYDVSGNAITVSGGMSVSTWRTTITLTASQTFSGGTFRGPIHLNGHTLTFTGSIGLLHSIQGTGSVIVNGSMTMTGVLSFTGTLTVNGSLEVVGIISNPTTIVSNTGSLFGEGTMGTTTVNGGNVLPGPSCCDPSDTDILATGNFSMTGGTFSVVLEGTTPGPGHDQLAVTGSVTLSSPTLDVDLTGAPLLVGQSFVILANDGVDAVSGTFAGLPEGATFTVGFTTFQITYAGGTGNDVVVTVLGGGPKVWTGAVSTLWSAGGNWNDGIPPADGDSLIFPAGTPFPTRTNTNDLAGLDLVSVTTNDFYDVSGNAITVSGGMSVSTWRTTITLTASQTFSGGTFHGPIHLNGHTLTFTGSIGLLHSIQGTGSVIVDGTMTMTGVLSFTGTLTVNGSLEVVGIISNPTTIVSNTGSLFGEGTMGTTTVSGGNVLPGPSCCDPSDTDILATGNFSMTGGTFGVVLEGTTPGPGHDQLAVNGSVTLSSPTLDVDLTGAPLLVGQSFVILANDGVDAVSGTFAGLPEGATFTVGFTSFQITYAGGTGNDVVVTVLDGGPKVWTGVVNNLWSAGGNWSDGIPPVDGDSLVFPDGAANVTNVNDLPGLDLVSVTTQGFYDVSGNPITVSGGMLASTWRTTITLTGSQTFSGGIFRGPIHLNGHTLTFTGSIGLLHSIQGTGNVVLNGSMSMTGTLSFTGTLTVNGGLDVIGVITNPVVVVSNSGTLTGEGTMGTTTVNGGSVSPGPCCLEPNDTDILATGTFSMTGGTFSVDLEGTTPGPGHDQLAVTGTVTLSNPTLAVAMTLGPVVLGQSFTILTNDGTDAVNGTFAGLPEGATFVVDGVTFHITYAGGTGNDVVLFTIAPTSTTLVSSQNPTAAFEPFTLTATVTSGFGVPAGTVNFREGATILASAAVDGTGNASATVALPVGSHTIAAEFIGTMTFANSNSAPISQTVTQGSTTLAITLNSNTIAFGDPLTITVDVDPEPPAGGVPGGAVSASGGGDSDAQLLSGGSATLVLDALTPGTHTITIDYSGDANFEGTSTTATVQVLPELTIGNETVESSNASTTVDVVVTLSGASNETVTVDFATADGTATAGVDYVAASGTLTFAPGDTSETITITILPGGSGESTETFRVVLSSPANAAIADGEATVTITSVGAIPSLGMMGLMLLAMALALAGAWIVKS